MNHRTSPQCPSRPPALRPLAIVAAIASASAAFAQEATPLGQVVVTAPAMEALVEWVRRNAPEDSVDTMADQPPTFLACPPEAMRGFLDELRARHGSIVGYADHIGLGPDEIAALRTRYLVP